MVAAFGAILAALALQVDFIESTNAMGIINAKKVQENFAIRPYTTGTVPGPYELHMYVDNLGTNPVEIVDVWFSDKSTPYTPTMVAINLVDSFVPPGATVEVLASQSQSISASSYTIKAVSSLGNKVTKNLLVPTAPGEDDDVVVAKLVAKPEVFASFPNPIGEPKHSDDSKGHGYFALVIANPTQLPMIINRTSLQFVHPADPAMFPIDTDPPTEASRIRRSLGGAVRTTGNRLG